MMFPQNPPFRPALPRKRQTALLHLTSCALLILPPGSVPAFASQPPQPSAEAPLAQDSDKNSKETKDNGGVSEEALRSQLVGKPLFLRGGYLGDSISFNEHGLPTGHPAAGSYTLSAIEIEKVHLTKHRVELEGSRYALHFLGALPSEDPNAIDRIKITPKKKTLKISIDRELVIKSKKVKEPKKSHSSQPAASPAATGQPVASSETDAPAATPAAAPQTAAAAPAVPTPAAPEAAPDTGPEQPGEQQAADQASVTTTISPAHAAKVLHDALDRIFASGLDEKLRAQMPEFWQLYYQAQAAGTDYRPHDPKVLRSSAVDQQAKLVSSIAPDSNEYAQSSGIAGRALYRAVIGPDGIPAEIAVVRPIGFGLDENAVAAIRKATFQAATKDGQPVAETLDLAVVFRIYSKRTSVSSADPDAVKPAGPIKPGPYSVQQPPQPAAPQQPATTEPQPTPTPDPQQKPATPPTTPN
jgi:TonB family protein